MSYHVDVSVMSYHVYICVMIELNSIEWVNEWLEISLSQWIDLLNQTQWIKLNGLIVLQVMPDLCCVVGTLLVDPESSVRNLAMTCLVSLYDVFGENMLEELMDNTALGSPHIRAVQEAISYRNTHTRGSDNIDSNNSGKNGAEWNRIEDNRNTDLRNTDFDSEPSGSPCSPFSPPQSSSQKTSFSKTRDSTGVGVKRGQTGSRLSSTGKRQDK